MPSLRPNEKGEPWAHDQRVSIATKQQTCPKYRAHNRAEEELEEELDVEEEGVDVEQKGTLECLSIE
jgi:hypothetical protein